MLHISFSTLFLSIMLITHQKTILIWFIVCLPSLTSVLFTTISLAPQLVRGT